MREWPAGANENAPHALVELSRPVRREPIAERVLSERAGAALPEDPVVTGVESIAVDFYSIRQQLAESRLS
jgi:hypothetical protein